MALATVSSASVLGVDGYIIKVEVDLGFGLNSWATVGLPFGAVRESKERVKSAIENSDFDWPMRRITVNLAPADIKKEGTAFDLPIAVGILTANQSLVQNHTNKIALGDHLIVGELGLNGQVRPVRGALSIAVAARDQGFKKIIVPKKNAKEAAAVEGIEVLGVETLLNVVNYLRGDQEITPTKAKFTADEANPQYASDLEDVKGQEHVKRALEVAATGGHNLLMIGPPGSGKTMLSKRIVTILPRLSFEESIETTKIYSVAGLTNRSQGLILTRPFRSPHHTISDVGIIGGGSGIPKPGEISLAHNGVLFLDEMPEFRRNVLEVMRQPLEDGMVTLTRSMITLQYPAAVMLVAAMNPCPCGYLGDTTHRCSCTQNQIHNYRARISGPLLDRFDLHVEVPAVTYGDLSSLRNGEQSSEVRKRVEKTRTLQRLRFDDRGFQTNARMTSKDVKKYCKLDKYGNKLLERCVDCLGMSARAYNRILKVARTISDLEKSKKIQSSHVAEAIQYRILDRQENQSG